MKKTALLISTIALCIIPLALTGCSSTPSEPTNNVPIAVADSTTTSENTPVTIDVLANDTDEDLDTLTVTNLVQPENGAVVINPNGTLTYTPTEDFSGSDSFTYTANDGEADSSVATVSITVNPEPELTSYNSYGISFDYMDNLMLTTVGVAPTQDAGTVQVKTQAARGEMFQVAWQKHSPRATYEAWAQSQGHDDLYDYYITVNFEITQQMGTLKTAGDIQATTLLGHAFQYRSFVLTHDDGYDIYCVLGILYCDDTERGISLLYLDSVITSEATALTNFNTYKDSFACHS